MIVYKYIGIAKAPIYPVMENQHGDQFIVTEYAEDDLFVEHGVEIKGDVLYTAELTEEGRLYNLKPIQK